jgi:hypothetical protein
MVTIRVALALGAIMMGEAVVRQARMHAWVCWMACSLTLSEGIPFACSGTLRESQCPTPVCFRIDGED